jgi:hypothetical protein
VQVNTILTGDCLTMLRTLPEGSVQCVVTSPPYWGLRDYGTAEWEGGDPECEHVCGGQVYDTKSPGAIQSGVRPGCDASTCKRCGARRVDAQLGLEARPDCMGYATGNACGSCYVCGMVAVFREVRRVLRDDGVCFLNLGDSYANDGKWGGSTGGKHVAALHGDSSVGRQKQTTGLKPKDLCGIPWRVALALQSDGWWLRAAITWCKCLSGGARVYARTQKGESPMTVKELVRLDPATVQLWDGHKWNQAVAWEETMPDSDRKAKSARARSARHRGHDALVGGDIELEFRNGERVGCTRMHKWPTGRGLVQACDLEVGDIVWTTPLPEPTAPVYPGALEDGMIGWFVGLYLAEGSKSDDAIQIACHADEIGQWLPRLQDLAERYHGSVAAHQTGNKALIVFHGAVLHGILASYLSGRTAHDKHLHPRCWTRSNDFLRAVLDGYLSGDAQEIANGWRLGFCANDSLANDLRCVAARLGLSLRLKRGVATETTTGKTFKCWRGSLRKREDRKSNDGEIIAIRQSRARRFWMISLRDEPHVFALASGILTGNSNPMPESVTDRPTNATEMVFLLAKSERYYYDAEAVKEPGTSGPSDLRKMLEQRERIGGLTKVLDAPLNAGNRATNIGNKRGVGTPGTRNLRNWWLVNTAPYRDAHFATFPEALVRPMILAGTSENGACPNCGAPWRRVVEKTTAPHPNRWSKQADAKQFDAGGNEYGEGGTLWVAVQTRTVGWTPTCGCAHPDLEAGDLDIIASPTGERAGEDPSIRTGRAGMNRPRGDNEGRRFITRFEQRKYAEQLRNSPHRADMEAEAGSAFAHYIRTDMSGARPVPYGLLDVWLGRGWLERVEVPDCSETPTVPCVVLDPFFGSGTVGVVAERLGRHWRGIELNPEYVALAERRIALARVSPEGRKAAQEAEAQQQAGQLALDVEDA